MPSIPQSLLWISLVVLWLFVLVPMLISKRDNVRRTSDVALATRVLNGGEKARRFKRSGPSAGHRHDPGRPFRNWLKAVIENAIRDFYRAQNRHPGDRAVGGSDVQQALANLVDPNGLEDLADAVEAVDDPQLAAAMDRVRGRLADTTWRAFWATTADGRPAAEVAAELGISVGSVFKAKYRVAGMLLLLYAQPLVKVVTLTTEAIAESPHGMRIQLGRHPVDVPEPFANMIRQHRDARPNLRTAAGTDSPWMFPSILAGRHLHPNTVMDRLRALGVNLLGARNSALGELVLHFGRQVDDEGIAPAVHVGIDVGEVDQVGRQEQRRQHRVVHGARGVAAVLVDDRDRGVYHVHHRALRRRVYREGEGVEDQEDQHRVPEQTDQLLYAEVEDVPRGAHCPTAPAS